MRSSRSVIYTLETLHFLEAFNIWLAFKRTTFNVCAFCMAARTVAALIMTGAFFSSRVLYKSVIRGVLIPAIPCHFMSYPGSRRLPIAPVAAPRAHYGVLGPVYWASSTFISNVSVRLTGVGIPASFPKRTTAPFIASISVFFFLSTS